MEVVSSTFFFILSVEKNKICFSRYSELTRKSVFHLYYQNYLCIWQLALIYLYYFVMAKIQGSDVNLYSVSLSEMIQMFKMYLFLDKE